MIKDTTKSSNGTSFYNDTVRTSLTILKAILGKPEIIMKDYIFKRIYEKEGNIPTAFAILNFKRWKKLNHLIDFDCYVKIGDKLYQPIKLNNK